MKCFECKQQVSTATIVWYIASGSNDQCRRHVCRNCFDKLKFDGCHHVVVKSLKSSKSTIEEDAI